MEPFSVYFVHLYYYDLVIWRKKRCLYCGRQMRRHCRTGTGAQRWQCPRRSLPTFLVQRRRRNQHDLLHNSQKPGFCVNSQYPHKLIYLRSTLMSFRP